MANQPPKRRPDPTPIDVAYEVIEDGNASRPRPPYPSPTAAGPRPRGDSTPSARPGRGGPIPADKGDRWRRTGARALELLAQTPEGRDAATAVAVVRAAAPALNVALRGGSVRHALGAGVRQIMRDGTAEHLIAHAFGIKLSKDRNPTK